MIERGWVSVGGRLAIPGDRALPDAEIMLSSEAKAQLKDAFTIVLNKPRGFVSSPDETAWCASDGFAGSGQFLRLGTGAEFLHFWPARCGATIDA